MINLYATGSQKVDHFAGLGACPPGDAVTEGGQRQQGWDRQGSDPVSVKVIPALIDELSTLSIRIKYSIM